VRERKKNDKQRNAPASERARERENNSTASDRGGLLLHTQKKNAKHLTFERRFAERQQWGGEPRPREKERERKRKPESDD